MTNKLYGLLALGLTACSGEASVDQQSSTPAMEPSELVNPAWTERALAADQPLVTPAGWTAPRVSSALGDRKSEYHSHAGWRSNHPVPPNVRVTEVDYESLPFVDQRFDDEAGTAPHNLDELPAPKEVLITDAWRTPDEHYVNLLVPGQHIGFITVTSNWLVGRFVRGRGGLALSCGKGAVPLRSLRWEWLRRTEEGELELHAATGWLDASTCRLHVNERIQSRLAPLIPGAVYAFRSGCKSCGEDKLHVITPRSSDLFLGVEPFERKVLDVDSQGSDTLELRLSWSAWKFFDELGVEGAKNQGGTIIEVQLSQAAAESTPTLLVTTL